MAAKLKPIIPPDGHSASAWSSAWLGLIPLFMNTGKLSTPQKISPTNLHAGTYYGYWSGYVIRLPLKDGDVEIKTEHGVRGVVKCVVTIDESGALSVMPNAEISNAPSSAEPKL